MPALRWRLANAVSIAAWRTASQPVGSAVELVLVDGTEAEFDAEAGGGGFRRERASRRELRAGIEDPADGEREDEIPAAVAVGSDEPVETDFARRAQRRRDRAVRQGADDADRLLVGRDDRAAVQERLEASDPLARPVGNVQKRALLDLAALAEALAQEDGGGRVAVGDRFDIHGQTIRKSNETYNTIIPIYMATNWAAQSIILPKNQSLARPGNREAPLSRHAAGCDRHLARSWQKGPEDRAQRTDNRF